MIFIRVFFITDIHGYYEPMIKLFEYAKVSILTDKLFIGGDMIDRGPDSALVVRDIHNFQKLSPSNVHICKGNHEQMIAWYFNAASNMFLKYGGVETLNSFKSVFGLKNPIVQEYVNWMSNLPLLIEHNDYIFTHAGIDPSQTLKEQTEEVIWTLQSDLYQHSKESIFKQTDGRKIVHGHTYYPYVEDDGCRISCDLGSIDEVNPQLGLVDLTNQIYYSYSLKTKRIKVKPIIKLYAEE